MNEKSKGVGIKHNLGDSKVRLPHVKVKLPHRETSHVVVKKPVVNVVPKPVVAPPVTVAEDPHRGTSHETNKTAWMIGAVGLGWWLFR